jgi:hypothetical protein
MSVDARTLDIINIYIYILEDILNKNNNVIIMIKNH